MGDGSVREEGPHGPIGQGLELGVYPEDRAPAGHWAGG